MVVIELKTRCVAFDEKVTSDKHPQAGDHNAKIRSIRCARSRAVSTSAA